MSEIPKPDQDPQQRARAAAAEFLGEQLGWLNEAAEIVGEPRALVEDVFASPPEVRPDAPEPNWTAEQANRMREVGYRLGYYGAEQNFSSGLSGGVRIVESALAWKIAAEAAALADEENPSTLVFAGSPYRTLRQDEHGFLQERLETSLPPDATEYDLAHLFARRQASKSQEEEPIILHFGYEVAPGNLTVRTPTGQLVHIGETETGQSVQLLRIDREIYEDENGIEKYKNQPDSAALMGFMADTLKAQGKKEKDSVGLMTSGAYASRLVDVVRAGINHNRRFGVAMYGRATLAKVKNEPIAVATALNQLPGDLRVYYDKLQQLRNELETTTS